jgi:hypothetical protein
MSFFPRFASMGIAIACASEHRRLLPVVFELRKNVAIRIDPDDRAQIVFGGEVAAIDLDRVEDECRSTQRELPRDVFLLPGLDVLRSVVERLHHGKRDLTLADVVHVLYGLSRIYRELDHRAAPATGGIARGGRFGSGRTQRRFRKASTSLMLIRSCSMWCASLLVTSTTMRDPPGSIIQ